MNIIIYYATTFSKAVKMCRHAFSTQLADLVQGPKIPQLLVQDIEIVVANIHLDLRGRNSI